MPPARSSSPLTPYLDAVQQHLKPYRAEALHRIRLNTFCIIALLAAGSLLPVPSLVGVVGVLVKGTPRPEAWTREWVYRLCGYVEIMLFAAFAFNIVESVYALQYPPPPLPPSPRNKARQAKSQAQAANGNANATPKMSFKVLSPNSSPQLQKPFAFSPSASFSSSLSGSTATGYPPSPISTPSRTLQYSTLSSSIANSSTSTVGYSPSPSAVFRGRSIGGGVGRALDGSYLGRLADAQSDSEEE